MFGIVQQNNLSCEAKRSDGGEDRVFVILPYVVRYICKTSLDEIQLLSCEGQNAANHISISGSLLQDYFISGRLPHGHFGVEEVLNGQTVRPSLGMEIFERKKQ